MEPDNRLSTTWMTAIDLFCGAGGLSAGFQQAGFHVLAGNDHEDRAGQTFEASHPGAVFIPGPVQDLRTTDLLHACEIRKGQLDCLIGGPPCQAYSVYNHQRGMHDERSVLFVQYLRLVEELHPRWLVIENVTGITSIEGGKVVREIKQGLRNLGYEVEMKVLKAEEYGVPQERRRAIFIANRVGKPILFPKKTHGPGLLPFVTIRKAIGDLPALKNGEDPGPVPYPDSPKSDYQRAMRRDCRLVHNHAATRLSKVNIDRMAHIPQGGSWRDIPHEMLPEGMKRAKRSDHTKRYGRMKAEGLACTILTKCDVHWGAYIHPSQDRSITVREAARLQSFSDDFVFCGSRTDQFIQVGNAVPPLLGKAIADAIVAADAGTSDGFENSQEGQARLSL